MGEEQRRDGVTPSEEWLPHTAGISPRTTEPRQLPPGLTTPSTYLPRPSSWGLSPWEQRVVTVPPWSLQPVNGAERTGPRWGQEGS